MLAYLEDSSSSAASTAALIGALVGLAIHIGALIDAARRPSETFSALGGTKASWLLAMFFVPFVSFVYLWKRRQFATSEARTSN